MAHHLSISFEVMVWGLAERQFLNFNFGWCRRYALKATNGSEDAADETPDSDSPKKANRTFKEVRYTQLLKLPCVWGNNATAAEILVFKDVSIVVGKRKKKRREARV